MVDRFRNQCNARVWSGKYGDKTQPGDEENDGRGRDVVTSNVAFAIKHVEEFVLWSDKSMVLNGTDAL